MPTLIERLETVMQAMNWEHSDLVRASQQSSSVVSQWLGKGSKIIKTIGKMEAAENIAAETGFSALWIAKGIGPQRVTRADSQANSTISQLQRHLVRLGHTRRKTVGDLLARLANEPENNEIAEDLALLMEPPGQQSMAA